jgi:hypothetical protein
MYFTATIQLAKISSRTEGIIAMLNNMSASGIGMQMTVLELSPFDDGQSVLGNVQLKAEELKFNFGVIAPSGAHIINFASRFNMASAMHCAIRYSLTGECLNVKFKPPDEKLEEVLRDFFELTEKSSN